MECNQSSFLLADSKDKSFALSVLSVKMSSSEQDSDVEDYLTLDTLSEVDLAAIARNPRYLLTELLDHGEDPADPGAQPQHAPRAWVLTPFVTNGAVLVLTPPPLCPKVPLPLTG